MRVEALDVESKFNIILLGKQGTLKVTYKANLTIKNFKLCISERNGAPKDLYIDLDDLSCLSKCVFLDSCPETVGV